MESTIDKLTKAVSKQVGGKKSLKEMAENVCTYGASGGFHGFIYYHETTKFFIKNKALIISMIKETADSLGESPIKMIASFNCLEATEEEIGKTLYGTKKDIDANVANALSWFALEEVCRALTDV